MPRRPQVRAVRNAAGDLSVRRCSAYRLGRGKAGKLFEDETIDREGLATGLRAGRYPGCCYYLLAG